MKRKIDHIDLYRHLTQQELLEYSKGVLGSEEMYKLELHLNECELCSDALEGIEQMNQPEELLESINESIQPKRQEVQFPKKYMAIAASILLVAAIGFTFWMLNPLNNEQSLAVNTTDEEGKETTQPEDKVESLVDTLPKTQEIVAVPDEEEPEEIVAGDIEQKTEATPVPSEPVQMDLAVNETEEKAKSNMQAKVSEEELVDADLALAEEADIVEDNFAEDEADKGMAAPTAAQERMVTSQTARAKKTSGAPSSEPVVDRNEPEPKGGMNDYKTYLKNNLVYPQLALDNKTKGTVVLEVTIAPNGAISNIRVLKGIGDGCDEEAKRLVLTGPQWLPTIIGGNPIEAKTEVKVRFKP